MKKIDERIKEKVKLYFTPERLKALIGAGIIITNMGIARSIDRLSNSIERGAITSSGIEQQDEYIEHNKIFVVTITDEEGKEKNFLTTMASTKNLEQFYNPEKGIWFRQPFEGCPIEQPTEGYQTYFNYVFDGSLLCQRTTLYANDSENDIRQTYNYYYVSLGDSYETRRILVNGEIVPEYEINSLTTGCLVTSCADPEINVCPLTHVQISTLINSIDSDYLKPSYSLEELQNIENALNGIDWSITSSSIHR